MEFWNRGTLSQTKYLLRETPEKVRITRRHHPLRGQELEVLREAKSWLVVRHPDGGPMKLLRRWTDADGAVQGSESEGETVFTVEGTRQLIALLAALGGRR